MQVEHAYDVPPRALLDVLTDLDFLRARGRRFGGNGEPAVDRSDDRIVVTVPRRLPVENIPGPLRRFAGDGALVQIDTWTRLSGEHLTGSWDTEVGSAPLELRGAHAIAATAGGCVYTVTADVKVRIPIGGGAATKLVRERLAELTGKELAFTAEWLRARS